MTDSAYPPDDPFVPDPAEDPPPDGVMPSGHDADPAPDVADGALGEVLPDVPADGGREMRGGMPVVRYTFGDGWASEAQWDAELAILHDWVARKAARITVVLDDPSGPADPADPADPVADAAVLAVPVEVFDPVGVSVAKAALVEQLVALERDEAALHGRRTRLFEQYRALSVRGIESAQQHPTGADKAGWNAEVIAWREMITEIATATRKAENAVAQLVNEAEILTGSLPATLTALETGEMSYRHASVIAAQAKDVPDQAKAEFEEAVVPVAATSTVSQLKYRARLVRERLHPDSIDARKKKAARGRYLEVDPADDGMALLTAKLAAVDAVAILNRCTETAHVLQNPTETRSLGELQTDVLRDLMINGTIPDDSPARTATYGDDSTDDSTDDADGDGAGGQVLAGGAATGIRATVLIMVPATTLLGRSDEPAILEGYGPIDLETATELAAGASSWIRVLTHPETGVIMSVGHTRYRVPAAMRLWLRIRDLICRFPGCNRKAKYCDLDHIIEWQYGGHTSTDNLHNLCELCRYRHNRHYAEVRIMPMLMVDPLRLLGSGWMLSA
jgi:hypothetical protein